MITDLWLTEVAKSQNAESYVVPGYYAVATTVVSSILSTDTALAGEIGSRVALTKSRASSTVTYTATRSAASVVNTSTGDVLASIGMLNAATGGTFLQGVVIGGVTQTTNFDIEMITTLTPTRS